QIDVGVALFKEKMAGYAQQYGLDGADDTICLVIADIRHQGRAKSSAILAALQSANPLNSLLNLGEPKYHQRVVTLRREINALTQDGTFGGMKYSKAKKDFVKK
ncbi:MAG TPA: hypothetical protein VFV34_03830, partial [Blastocatellia bacterium]|nr:hypothetical protein [Blastocatellia bacterium]